MKYIALLISSNLIARTIPNSTSYSKCTKQLNSTSENQQIIIVTMENLNSKSCKSYGLKKAVQYQSAGWNCEGLNRENYYSCESEPAAFYSLFNQIKLDNLTFTNLQKHRAMVGYVSPTGLKLCHEDQEELKLAGVKDATCHKRQSN